MLTHLLPMLQSGSSDAINLQYSGQGELGTVPTLIGLAVVVLTLIAMWKVFTKAGEPGWAILVPIYNIIVYLRIAGKPAWWLILFLIPIVNFVIAILVAVGFAKAFGKGIGFALGLVFLGPIFIMILAFGDAKFQGNQG